MPSRVLLFVELSAHSDTATAACRARRLVEQDVGGELLADLTSKPDRAGPLGLHVCGDDIFSSLDPAPIVIVQGERARSASCPDEIFSVALRQLSDPVVAGQLVGLVAPVSRPPVPRRLYLSTWSRSRACSRGSPACARARKVRKRVVPAVGESRCDQLATQTRLKERLTLERVDRAGRRRQRGSLVADHARGTGLASRPRPLGERALHLVARTASSLDVRGHANGRDVERRLGFYRVDRAVGGTR